MSIRTRTKVLLIGIAIGLVTGTANGGVNEKMQQMFGSANVTRPGYVDSASRGVITGGNMSIRSPIVQPGGFSFDPPSISAGCGGIDLYGGNLSFPSKEQYVAAARAIAMNIGGYAFKQGLKQLCDVCESVMSQIQDTVNELNMDNMNSCQIAQGIVSGDKSTSMGERGRNIAAIWSKDSGNSKDYHEGYAANKNESPSKEAVQDPKMKAILEGNWTWQSLEKTGAFDWLGTDQQTREEVMSLLGTVITCVSGTNGCPNSNAEGDNVVRVLSPQLRLQDFVALDEEQSEMKMYSCGSSKDCLNPSQTARRRLGSSASQKIVDILLGKDGNPGYLKRMVLPGSQATPVTAAERSVVQSAGPIVSRAVACIKSGQSGEGFAETLVRGYSQRIAAESLYKLTDQSLTYLIQDLNNRSTAIGSNEGAQQLEKSREQLSKDYQEIVNKIQRDDMVVQALDRCAVNPLAQLSNNRGSM